MSLETTHISQWSANRAASNTRIKMSNENKKSFRLELNHNTRMHTISKAATTRSFINFSFHAFAALYFHALRWPSSHAFPSYCSAYTCLSSTVRMSKSFPRLPALENAEEINFLFCLWSRGPAATLNPPARGHSPGSPLLPLTCHVNMPLLSCQKKMFPHHIIICHLRASNPRPQLTKFVLLLDMEHISGTASNQDLGPGSYD